MGTDAFQEADIVGITMPITKHSFLVKDAADIPGAIAAAYEIAGTGRPGPVLVDITKDAQQATAPFVWPPKIDLPGYRPVTKAHGKQIQAAAALLAEAKKPVLYVGGGVIRTADVPIVGDVRDVLTDLDAAFRGATADAKPDIEEWWSYLDGLRNEFPLGYAPTTDGLLAPQYVIQRIGELTGPEGIFASGVAIINNSSLGMVRQWQTLFYDGRHSNTDLNTGHGTIRIPDFVKLAEAYGCLAIRVEKEEEVDAAIQLALETNDRPVVIDFVVSADSMVWPMVPQGVSNSYVQYARDHAPAFDEED
ncbi:unnamed protein product [Penicillium discolor]